MILFRHLYIRDLDPDSLPPEKNTDLLMERSPVELVKFTGISTDKGWKSLMSVSAESTEKFIYPVFQKAFKDQGSLRCGRLWTLDYGELHYWMEMIGPRSLIQFH